MTALNMELASHIERWTHHSFPLTAGTKSWKGGLAVIDTATGKVKPGAAAAGLIYIGKFDESVDASAAEKPVSVDLGMEIEVVWWNNDGTVTAAMVGGVCYVQDDQTVTATATTRSLAGRVWLVDAIYGVAVQKVPGLGIAAPAAAEAVAEDAGEGDAPPPSPSAKSPLSSHAPPTSPSTPHAQTPSHGRK